jgi:excisionase family DNA binding protein
VTQLLHTPEQAADVLSISRTRVYELMAAGDLKSVKLGRSRRIPDTALRAFVDSLTAAV